MANKKDAKRKKRIKPGKLDILPIKNWKEADGMLRSIGRMLGEIKTAERRASEKIGKIKAELTEAATPPNAAIKQYTRSLQAFSSAHKADLKVKRSRKLNFGIVGWRKSTSISITSETINLIKKVFSKKQVDTFVHCKETVDKEALSKLTDGQLVSLDAKRKVKDGFFIEPDLTKVAGY